ncbi:MAG: hypothetical protein RJA10_2494 [Pseudomonadota bacterium]|jgi:uncharacterized OB-fold protein
MSDAVSATDCWTRGGNRFVYQRCRACARQWLFMRDFCPHCGVRDPVFKAAAGTGTVCATTLVHRAPDDAFRVIAPYRLVLVDLDEGLRLMAHADPSVAVGDRVQGVVRTIAGRPLPCFSLAAA